MSTRAQLRCSMSVISLLLLYAGSFQFVFVVLRLLHPLIALIPLGLSLYAVYSFVLALKYRLVADDHCCIREYIGNLLVNEIHIEHIATLGEFRHATWMDFLPLMPVGLLGWTTLLVSGTFHIRSTRPRWLLPACIERRPLLMIESAWSPLYPLPIEVLRELLGEYT